MALGTSTTSSTWKAMKECGFDFRINHLEILRRGKTRRSSKIVLSPNALCIVRDSVNLALSTGCSLARPEHLLQAIINECNGYAELALGVFNLDATDLDMALRKTMENEAK